MSKAIGFEDRWGNLLFTSEWVEDGGFYKIVIDQDVKDATGMGDLTLYSGRAMKELVELLTTMMTDTGH